MFTIYNMYLLNQQTKQKTQTRSQQKPQTSSKCFRTGDRLQPQRQTSPARNKKNENTVWSQARDGHNKHDDDRSAKSTQEKATKTSSSAESENRTRNTRISGRTYSVLHPRRPCLFAERTPETLNRSGCLVRAFEHVVVRLECGRTQTRMQNMFVVVMTTITRRFANILHIERVSYTRITNTRNINAIIFGGCLAPIRKHTVYSSIGR